MLSVYFCTTIGIYLFKELFFAVYILPYRFKDFFIYHIKSNRNNIPSVVDPNALNVKEKFLPNFIRKKYILKKYLR